MTRSVNQIEGVTLISHLNSVTFDSNTTLFFQIHIVQHLIFHLALVDSLCEL